MQPPPVLSPRSFAPGLVPRKQSVDPYDPIPKDCSDTFTLLRKDSEEEEEDLGTWMTIDPDTGSRSWDRASRRQWSQRGSDASSDRSFSRKSSRMSDTWTQSDKPISEKGFAMSTIVRGSTMSLSHTAADGVAESVDPEVRRLFVDTSDIMTDSTKSTSAFDVRNQKSLHKGNATVIKNMIGNDVVSIVHQPVDDRAKYRDENGNYIDGINRGLMKKRYEDEWRNRLNDRKAQMEHLTKLKREWEDLSPAEQAQRIARREANAHLLNKLGAGIEATDDIFEFDEVPEVYRRRAKWIVSGHGSRTSSLVSNAASSVIGGPCFDASFDKDHLTSSVFQEHRQYDPSRSRRRAERYDERRGQYHPSHHSHQPTANRGYTSARDQLSFHIPFEDKAYGKRKRSHHEHTPSDVLSGRYSAYSQPSLVTIKATSTTAPSSTVLSSKPTPSVTSETPSIVESALDLAPLEDLPEYKHFENHNEAISRYDRVKNASAKHGRIVQVTIQKPVHFTSSAVCDRLFAGAVQEIQFFPAERMALVAFIFPSEAEAFVAHVKNLKQDKEGFEYRRLQIDADWYKGLHHKAVYPAQSLILASVLAEGATRVLLVTHIPVDKKVENFANEMKGAFPEKIIVKVELNGIARLIPVIDHVSIIGCITENQQALPSETSGQFGDPRVREHQRCYRDHGEI